MQKDKKKEMMELELVSVVIEEDAGTKGMCKRIIFTCTDGKRVTFSPKDTKLSQRTSKEGLTVQTTEKEAMCISDLPDVLFNINNKIKEKNTCKIKAIVTAWDTTDKDADPVTYYFFGSMKDFENIKIV